MILFDAHVYLCYVLIVSSRTAWGLRSTKRLTATFQGRAGSLTEVHSYDVPNVQSLIWEIHVEYLNQQFLIGDGNLPTHPDPVAPGSIFVVGAQFGESSFTSRVRTSHSASMATKWLSSTLLNCKMASGLSETRAVFVTAGSQSRVGSHTFAMSHDTPSPSSFTYHSSFTNILRPGMRIHTVSGDNFGMFGLTMEARTLGTSGEGTFWNSDTSLAAKMASGHAYNVKSPTFHLTAGEQVGSISQGLSYDLASVSSARPANAPALIMTTLLELSGVNVGAASTSQRASLGHSACDITNWESDSSLFVKTMSGVGNWKDAVITIAADSATRSYTLSYDVPRQTSLDHNNPAAVSFPLLVFASNFGKADYTSRAMIGGTAVRSSQWASDTIIAAKPASGLMFTHFEASMVLTVGVWCPKYVDEFGLVYNYVEDCKITDVQYSTASRAFSYDSPAPLGLKMLGMELAIAKASTAARGDSVSIVGSNFARQDYSDMMRLGSTQTEISTWKSDTSLLARFSTGLQGSHQVILTAGHEGSMSSAFSYLGPAILMPFAPLPDTFRSNAPGTGATVVYLNGVLMGHSSYTIKARISYTTCGASTWNSDTSITCMTNQGGGGGPVVQLTAGENVNSATEFWSYDGPHPYEIFGVDDPNLAKSVVTIKGSNYQDVDITQKIRFGPTNCEFSKWFATTSITCKRPSGPASAAARDSVVVTVTRQYKTLTTAFSYDLHSVQSAIRGNTPATGACHFGATRTHAHTHIIIHTHTHAHTRTHARTHTHALHSDP